MFGGQLGVVCSPVVLIDLSVLARIMMKAFCLAAGDDGDDGDGTDAAKARTFTHSRIDFSAFWACCCPEQYRQL